MLVYGLVSYFGGTLYGYFGARTLLWLGLTSAAVASVLLSMVGPGGSWWVFNGSLVLLGIDVGAVIPTVSSRAIEVAGIERASLVSGIVFMCQLSGAAVLLAVNTAIFSAASAWQWERSSAAQGIVLAPDQRQAVQEVMAGARNIHAVPLRTVTEVEHLAEIIEQAYQYGLRLAMWFSAALVVVVLILVLRYVRSGPDSPGAGQGRGGEARHL